MSKVSNWLEDTWEKHSVKISIFLSIIVGILYYLEVIDNLRDVLSDVISFSSIVVGINGVFITLIITIKLTPAFIRLKGILPNFENRLFGLLRSQVMIGLTVVIVSIMITMLPYSPSKLLSAIGTTIWSFFFILMAIGSFFTMNLVINIILANEDDPKVNKRP
ncbi:hypothetical protein LG329_18675 [Virgibacillus necropolis]|uniref:hypothetical protein n=1 Tax=Virgibacillus necropolis TaxID=163877 RepID=UPI00384EB256